MKLNDPVEFVLKRKGWQVHTISPDATVYEALEKLAEEDIGALPVVDGTDLVGMFSERDYARNVILKGRFSRETSVREVMSTSLVTVNRNTTIDECMNFMTNKRCRHLPVVEGGRIVGLVSLGDLVNWIISTQDFTISQLENYITGKYPA